MLRQINKKIIFYISLVIILGTFNNKNLKNFDLPKINMVNIEGIEFNNNEFLKIVNLIKLNNLLSIQKSQIKEILNSNNLIEEYEVFKRYPSSIEIKIDNYYDNFIENGLITLNLIKQIEDKKKLNDIGINNDKHCEYILTEIQVLRIDSYEWCCPCCIKDDKNIWSNNDDPCCLYISCILSIPFPWLGLLIICLLCAEISCSINQLGNKRKQALGVLSICILLGLALNGWIIGIMYQRAGGWGLS